MDQAPKRMFGRKTRFGAKVYPAANRMIQVMNAMRVMDQLPKRMFGSVEHNDGRYFIVVCPDAPPHLQRLNLTPGQVAGAKIGDNVELEYQTTSRSGLWNVIRVFDGRET